MFGNLKVSSRLALGFGVVSLLLAATVVLGIHSVAKVSDNVDEMVKDKYPKVVVSYDLIGNVNEIAIAMRNIVLSDSADATRGELARIDTARKAALADLDKLKKLVKSAQGRQLMDNIVEQREKYLATQSQFVLLVGEGRRDEARALLTNQIGPLQHAYIAAVGKLIEHQSESMDHSGEEAAAEYVDTRNEMILLGVLAVALGIGMACWITLSLTRTLGGEPAYAAALLKGIADGDLSADVVIRKGDRDSMLFAVGQMVAKLRQVFAAANAARMAIVVHLRANIRNERPYGAAQARLFLDKLMPAAPDVAVQVAHLAGSGPGFDDPPARAVLAALALACERREAGTRNLWFDVASIAGRDIAPQDAAEVARRIRQIGVARVLYGTDAAQGGNLRPREAWATFLRLPLGEGEFARIARNVPPYFL